jgi:hypothetical protein
MSKANYQVKQLKLTEATEAWIESELASSDELEKRTAQSLIRDELHKLALRKLRKASVLVGIAARRGIRGDGGGHS